MINPLTSPLLTDLYQLTMMETYLQTGMDKTAVFEFYVRNLPPNRGFLVAAGLNSVLSFLENLRFSQQKSTILPKPEDFPESFWPICLPAVFAEMSMPCPRERSVSPMSP